MGCFQSTPENKPAETAVVPAAAAPQPVHTDPSAPAAEPKAESKPDVAPAAAAAADTKPEAAAAPEAAKPIETNPSAPPADAAAAAAPAAAAESAEQDKAKAEAAPAPAPSNEAIAASMQPVLNEVLAKQAEETAKHAAELSTGPLMEPIEGVDLKTYATISAEIGRDPQRFEQTLGTHQLTKEQWDRVQEGWQARMKADGATGSIMTMYGKYYNEAGTGRFGGMGQAGAGATSAEGVQVGVAPAADAGAPCSFDKYCEILGAQSAWSAAGLDVNEQLRKVFNLNANDFSNIASYHSAKMMADMSLGMAMGAKMAAAQAKYAATPDGDGTQAM